MAGRLTIRWAWFAAVCACAATGVGPRAAAAELIRLDAASSKNTQPIRIHADEAIESVEGTSRYYRLLGKVFIDQGGFTRVWAERAILRIDLERQRRDQLTVLAIYAEGAVKLEHGPHNQRGQRAAIELSSTAEPELHITKNAGVQSLAADPFFHRAREAWVEKPAVVQTAAQVPPETLPLPTPVPGRNPPPSIFAAPQTPAPPRIIRIAPRTGKRFEMESLPDAILVTGGILMTVSNVEHFGILDLEADNAVIWTKGDSQQFFQRLQSGQGESTRESEFYLSGNVILRSRVEGEERVLRADRLYYDVSRNIGVAVSADVEFREKGLPDPLHFKADEVFQLGPDEFRAVRAEIFSSRLPSDPGLKIVMGEAMVAQRRVPRTSILGRQFINPLTGEPEETTERFFQGENVQLRVADLPIFWTPFVQGTVTNPTGPLRDVTFHHDRIFGYHVGADLDLFNLLGIDPAPGRRWTGSIDEFTKRGPGLGTTYEYSGNDLFAPGHYSGLVKLYGMYDTGVDVLGGPRTGEPHPAFRGRDFWRHMQELPEGWQILTQISFLSDKNFLEQYYKPEFDQELNQETFFYLNKRRDDWGASLLVEPNIRHWATETMWLPKAEGQIVGWSPMDLLTYNARTSLGYARLQPTSQAPPPLLATDGPDNTLRFDLWQELSLPFNLGPFKVVPFGKMDVAAYSSDLAGDPRGRFYVGGGATASLPFSRLYRDAYSDLLNVQGIYHKAVFSATYYGAWSSTPFNQLPQLDRLNDDATDQSLRDITPLQPVLNPANGVALATSPIFNPQLYAIRRLIDTRADTLDSIQEFQLDLRQRWQTKRGFPGLEHTVDLLTLDVSMALFPNANRDNFGSSVGFVEYDAVWNVGDRTSVLSTGWFDPFNLGTRYVTIGANMNRPDGTLFGVSFRYADPIQSRLLSASASYVFSPKYSLTAATSYDFGYSRGLWNSLLFTRNGTDLQLTVGVSYNPLLNNFGFNINVVPILVANQRHSVAAPSMLGAGRGF